MKKVFSWILSLALIFSLLPNQVFAASTLEFSSEKEGEKIVVTLTLPKYEKVMAAEAVVEFSDALKLESVTSGTYSPLDFEEPNVETATTKGKVTIGHSNETLDTATIEGEYAKLTFSIKDGTAPGSYDIKLTELTMTATDYVTNIAASDAATLPKTISVVVPKAPITSVTASVKAPEAGKALDFAGTVDTSAPYSISKVEWFEGTDASGTPVTGPATAKANQFYYARITLTAKSGETFAASLDNTVSDIYSVARNSDTELYLTKAYDKTGSLPAATVTHVPTAKTVTYDGTEQELVNAGTTSDGTMQYSLDNVTWSTTSPKGTDAGEYIVYYMVKGDSGHSDSAVANVKVTIGQKGINDSTVTIDTIPNQTYDGGNELKPLPTVKDGTTELTKDTDYTVSYDNNKNAGTNTAKLTITGQGNYTGTKDANFTIDPADQVLTVPGSTNVAFGTTLNLKTVCSSNAPGAALTFAKVTTSSLPTGTTFEESTGIVTAGNNTGSFVVTVDSAAVTNYKAALQKTITVYIVNKTPSSYTTEPEANTGLKYDGSEQALVTAGAANGGTVKYSLDNGATWRPDVPTGKNADTYTVQYKIVGDETHSDSTPKTHTVTIGQKEVTVSGITAENKEYNGNTDAAVNTSGATFGGIVDGDELTVSVAAGSTFDSADVGSRTVTLGTLTLGGTSVGNYKLATTGNQTTTTANITPRDLTVTPDVNQSKKFGAEDPTLTFMPTGAVPGQTPSFTGALSRVEGQNVGQYDITLGTLAMTDNDSYGFKASNYTLKLNLTPVKFEIKKADAPTLPDISVSQKYNVTTEQSKDIGTAGMPEDAGTLTYTEGTPTQTTGSVAIDSASLDATTGKVTYKLSGGKAGDTVTLPVTIESTNYENATVNVVITLTKPSSSGGTSYAITVEKAENGTVSADRRSASKGSTVTITVKPDKGYELDALKVLDKNGDKVKLTEKNGKYTFTMPAGKVTVKGSFVEETPVQIFKDVPVDAYYYEAVKWAAEKGITGGVGNGLFAPNQPCTRGQIVTFLWRAAGSPAPKSMSSFADVPADAFYAKAVAWAVENGITSGTGDGKFSPDATCTRAQAVTFLYRAAGSPKVSGSAEFGDVATNAYYADAVAWAAKNGITGGIGGGLFGSNNDCTRAQIVTFLYRSAK